MPAIKGKTLFFTTSPRTPLKMVPEIQLLADKFQGKPWNPNTQAEYTYALVKMDFYQGSQQVNDPAFSARDRINRAPKAYGFVDLKPSVALTGAGDAFVNANHKEEPLLRQLVKFQLPSPFHTLPRNSSISFWVKPYLELLRLIHHFGSLTFDEVMIFGMQLIDYRQFEAVVAKIEAFRNEKARRQGRYRDLLNETCSREIRSIYTEEFETGDLRTRESDTRTAAAFIKKKRSNLRDYTDACFRYLRATGVVTISQSGHSLSIAPEKADDVEYLLETVDRNPVFVEDEKAYKEYLYNPELPKLYSDDFDNLTTIVHRIDPTIDCYQYTLIELKDLQYDLLDREKQRIIDEQAKSIKDYREYDDIVQTFEIVKSRDAYYDRPLMFEWNTWRAMTMIDGGSIKANLNFDDAGRPLSTAAGNMADIECDYEDFILNVEVTLQTGQKQYDNEGEPVARHVGKTKELRGKPTYCFFIAPTISEATIAHFFTLLHTPIRHYGGKATIIPIELSTCEKMVADSKKASYVPNPQHILGLVDKVRKIGMEAEDEIDWFDKTRSAALSWLESA